MKGKMYKLPGSVGAKSARPAPGGKQPIPQRHRDSIADHLPKATPPAASTRLTSPKRG